MKKEMGNNWKPLWSIDVFKDCLNGERIDVIVRDFRQSSCETRSHYSFWGEDMKVADALFQIIKECCYIFMMLAKEGKK